MIVVIPIHNQEANIQRVLDGYMKQSERPKHVVLVFDRCSDASKSIAAAYLMKFKLLDMTLHLVDTAQFVGINGFGAGRTRDIGVNYAIDKRLGEQFLFTDGDCIPSIDLVAHHAQQLCVSAPRITCGQRWETLGPGEPAQYELMKPTAYGELVQGDMRVYASWCRGLVFGFGYDRLVIDPQVFRQSWICWSCNLGMNLAAIKLCWDANGFISGDVKRVFNSAFDGRWGGEDGFVGDIMFRYGGSVVAMSERSQVTHLWHERKHTNLQHLGLLAELDLRLAQAMFDKSLACDPVVYSGVDYPLAGSFDARMYNGCNEIKLGAVLSDVFKSLDTNDFYFKVGLGLLNAGVVKFEAGPWPTRQPDVDVDKHCAHVVEAVKKMCVGVSGELIYKVSPVPRYGG